VRRPTRIRGSRSEGNQIFTNVLGKPLSSPSSADLPEHARHDLPVWITRSAVRSSPTTPRYGLENEIWFTFGWPYETTACVTRLIFSGIYDELRI